MCPHEKATGRTGHKNHTEYVKCSYPATLRELELISMGRWPDGVRGNAEYVRVLRVQKTRLEQEAPWIVAWVQENGGPSVLGAWVDAFCK